MRRSIAVFSSVFFSLLVTTAFSQITNITSSATPAYPRVTGHVGILHPIITINSGGTVTNFSNSYTVGVPAAVNIWKTAKAGFSFEVVPFIHAEHGISKMSNILFHPGILAALGKGYTFAGRLAFETSGRYGFTPLVSKVIRKGKYSSYYVSLPFPVRFGNDKPTSFTSAFQFGLAF